MPEFLQKNFSYCKKICAAIPLVWLLNLDNVDAQLFTQTFSTVLAPVSNDSLKTPPYCSAAPDNTQLTSIASSGPGAIFEVNSAGKLVLSRTNDVAVFTRAVDFNPIPATEIWKFDISISGNTIAQTNGAKFLTGYNLGTVPFGEESDPNNIRGRIGLNWTANPGEFSFRNAANTISSVNFNGEQTVFWVQNNSGSTVSYMAPDGQPNTLNAGFEDLWVGTTQVFNETPAVNSARTLRRIKFILNAGSVTVNLDNILVAPVTPAPSAVSSQSICGVINPSLANLSATGTSLQWYGTPTGGSPLPLSTPVTNGSTWYVSQTQNGIESVRTAVTVTLTSVTVDNNTIAADQTICTGSTPATLTGAVPSVSGGSGTFSYVWEISSTSAASGFTVISGATAQDLTFSSTLTANRWYRRRVNADACINYSNAVAVTITQPISGNTVNTPASAACSVIPAATITASQPSGGSGIFTYQWESSTTSSSGPFTQVPASNAQNLSPGILSQTTWFRRIVTSGACAASTSAAVQLTVNLPVQLNDATGIQTICTGSTPSIINGSLPEGGNGTTFAYAWQSSSTLNGTYNSISGANAQNYQPGALSSTIFYRRQVSSGACPATFSDTIQVTVNPVISNNTISPNTTQNICSANTPPAFTGSAASGGNGVILYQWESSTTNGTSGFSAISGANSQNYAPGILTQTTWFRRVASAGVCPVSNSNVVQYSVTLPITNNDASGGPQIICTGSTPTQLTGSLPVGGNGTFAYVWQSSSNINGPYSNVSGATLQNYQPPALSTTTFYRRQVSSGFCPITFSDTIQVTVNAQIGSNTITAAATPNVCSSIPAPAANGNAASGGTGIYAYQWEASVAGSGSGFSAISGADGQNYSPGLLAQNTWFRRVITSGVCPASTSNVLAYSVTNPILNNDATPITSPICVTTIPEIVPGSLPTGGNGTFTYTWEQNTTFPSASWGTATGISNQQNYTRGQTLPVNIWVRRRVNSGFCPATYSDTIAILVNATLGSNSISAASTPNVCSSNPAPVANGNLASGGTGVYLYQWESSTTSSTAGFSSITGANAQNYAPGLLSQSTWFRRVISSGVCPAVTSNVLAYSVTLPISNNDASGGPQTICTGTIPGLLTGSSPSGGNGTFSYNWQSSSTLNGTYNNVSGGAVQSFQPPSLSSTIFYRRQVASGFCPVSFSDTIQITVNPVISNNTISPGSTQNVCSANTPPPFTGSAATGGNGVILYQWESSTTSSTAGFSSISGANSQNYSPGLLTQTTWFRRVVSAGVCPVSNSNVVQYTVTLPITNNDAIGGPLTICTGSTPTLLTGTLPSGGNGTFSYAWQASGSLNGTYNNVSGGSGQNFQPPALSSTVFYRRQVSSGFCPVSFSDTIQITVNPVISGNSISPNTTQNVCSANLPPAFTGSNPSGGNGTYLYQWESSTTSGTAGFSAIPGANLQSYSPGLLSQTTWFRRIVSAGVCPASISNVVQYTVTLPITNNDASGNQTICANTAPALISGSLPSGGNGTFSYLWESATSASGPFSNAGGSSSLQNYTSGVLSSSRWFRRRVSSGFCPVTYSDTVLITVTPAISNNNISGVPTSLCLNSAPASPFTGSVVPTLSGGTGAYNFQWEFSTVSSTGPFAEIAGATSSSYSSDPLSVDTWFRRRVVSGVCTSYSSVSKVTIVLPVSTNDINANQLVCPGSIPDTLRGSLPGGGTGTFTYQWQSSTAGLSGPFSSISGATGRNYLPAAISVNTWFIRRVSSSSACPASFSDTVQITVYPSITNNVIFGAQVVCDGTIPQPLTGTIPSGGDSTYTYQWQISLTGPSSNFSDVSGETGLGIISPIVTTITWYRRIVSSGSCQSTSNSLQLSTSPNPTVTIGPAMADIAQGGISDSLGGSFGGSATGAVWTASEGSFFNNGGLTPDIATFKASLTSSPVVTLTLTSTGGPCPAVSLSKTINVIPDPSGITGVVNQYGQVIGPANLPVGSLSCTLANGQGARFTKNDRALLIQMKGAEVNLPSNPSDETFGYITAMENSGNHEYLFVDSVAGDVIFFRRCIKKAYTIANSVQLVKVAVYNGNFNIKGSTTVSAIRLTRKGMGYPPNATISSGFTITPVLGGTGLQLEARSDEKGQIYEVEILDPGNGYLKPPLIQLPDPTIPPFDFPAYRAKAEAVLGLTAKQWNGRLGGILCMEVNGNVTLNDSINLKGMGFSGGMPGDRGDIAPVCGSTAEYILPSSSFERSGEKGEGISVIPAGSERGKGRYGTGGGGGIEPEGGGGGGANWQDGGRGGASGYIAIPLSACSTSITPCDNDGSRGGLGGGTNPSTPITLKNVLRINSYSSTAANCRIFLGGGGGGGHAFNFARGLQQGGAGGCGGGLVILKGKALKSNGMIISAEGNPGENADQDGAGGGGAGGAVLLDFEIFSDVVRARVNGGQGGNANPLACDDPGDLSYPIRYRYLGAGGGGGGGVVWFSKPADDLIALSSQCKLGQATAGYNGDLFNSLAKQGGSSRAQSDLFSIENIPYSGSVFTVGGTNPKPDFPNLAKAAEFLAIRGTDASDITLRLTPNSYSSAFQWYKDPVVFKPITTPGCTVSDAGITIQPNGGINFFVLLQNSADDLPYIRSEGIPKITFENIVIGPAQGGITTDIIASGGTKMIFKNVNAEANIISDSAGNNPIELNNSTVSGNIGIGSNQTLKVEGSNVTVNGDENYPKAITLGSGSKFYLGDGRILNLNGAGWINNGADSVVISNSASLRFSGNFSNQEIGGTAPSFFDRLDVTSTGTITCNSGVSVGFWNQTGSATVSTSNQIIRIWDKVTSGTGSFISTGPGRVSLDSDDNLPVSVTGSFDNLEVNSLAGATVLGKTEVNQNLLLRTGKITADSNNASLIVQNPDPFSVISFGQDSWVRGILQRKVQAGGSYLFPVGDMNSLQSMNLNLASVSGGLSRLNVRFNSRNPGNHPLESVVIPYQEGDVFFRDVLPGGYWRVSPDSGSADYSVWLYPRFFGDYPQYSIMKRPASSNEWQVYGNLENPDSTYSFIQSDSSVRRSGLSGFSDFAVAGGEDPLPLRFLDFRVANKEGMPFLSWIMADCADGTRFEIWRGADKLNLYPCGERIEAGAKACLKEFTYLDKQAGIPMRNLYYQVRAFAPDELPAHSAIRIFNPAGGETRRAFLATLPESPKKLLLVGEGVDLQNIALYTADGRLVTTSLPCSDRLIDLEKFPDGLYIAAFLQDGQIIRQRIALRK